MPQMDGLRAIAVLAVLVHHWLTPVWPVGHWGVRLFFVISGYLITKSIIDLKHRRIGLWPAARRFFVRRSLRLFPAYYLTVLIGAAFFEEVRDQWPWYAGYLTNMLMAIEQRWIPLTPSWSLAVEEQFYLAWFFVVMSVDRRPRIVLLLAMLLLAPTLRYAALASGNQFMLLTLWSQFDALAAGALLFEAERNGWRFPLGHRPTLAFMGAGLLGLLAAWLLPALADAAALAMLALAVWLSREGFDTLAGTLLRHPWLVQLGKISYGVYLYHMVVPVLLDWMASGIPGLWRMLVPDTWPAFGIRTVVTLALAQLSFRYFEQPVRHSQLGSRWALA